MTNYYCLVAGLPDLSLDDGKLNYTIENFKTEIYPDLSEKDKKIIDLFYLKFDNANLLLLLKDRESEINPNGNYTSEELLSIIDAVKEDDSINKCYPKYLYDFVKTYLDDSSEKIMLDDDVLAGYFYSYAMKCSNKFIRSWYEFNLNLNNLFTAFNARKYGLDVANYIIGKSDISDKIRNSNARDFGLTEILEYFESVVRLNEIDDLLEREKKIDLLKWDWMENATFFNYFTVERLFVFLVKLEMIQRWLSLDKEKGNEKLRNIIESLRQEITISAEFK